MAISCFVFCGCNLFLLPNHMVCRCNWSSQLPLRPCRLPLWSHLSFLLPVSCCTLLHSTRLPSPPLPSFLHPFIHHISSLLVLPLFISPVSYKIENFSFKAFLLPIYVTILTLFRQLLYEIPAILSCIYFAIRADS